MEFQSVALGRVNGVAASTGFSCKKMYGRLNGTKKGNYKVTVFTRWPYGEVPLYKWLNFSIFVSVFDQLDLVTYEEVVKLDYFKRKTLVLLGKALNIFKLHLYQDWNITFNVYLLIGHFRVVLSLCQNKFACEIIQMKLSTAYMFIFIRKVLHRDSFWNRGTR